MALALGWYGPLIDLSEASSHIGDFVQLLLFVHRSAPFQWRSSKGRSIIRTDIQVGDDTRQYFGVSVWQKSMGSMISVGDVILLQNVKIVKFGDIVEARTVQWSSLLCLIHPYELLISKDIEELVAGCRVGITSKDKLRKVIKWVQQSKPNICNINSCQVMSLLIRCCNLLYFFKGFFFDCILIHTYIYVYTCIFLFFSSFFFGGDRLTRILIHDMFLFVFL